MQVKTDDFQEKNVEQKTEEVVYFGLVGESKTEVEDLTNKIKGTLEENKANLKEICLNYKKAYHLFKEKDPNLRKWYKDNFGFSKNKSSVILQRGMLYEAYKESEEYISTLSDNLIRIICSKDADNVKGGIIRDRLSNFSEIKKRVCPSVSDDDKLKKLRNKLEILEKKKKKYEEELKKFCLQTVGDKIEIN